MELAAFNQLTADEARATIRHCVAIPRWQEALVSARPFYSREALLAVALDGAPAGLPFLPPGGGA